MVSDQAFESALRGAVDAEVSAVLASGADPVRAHRGLMDRVRLVVAAYLWPASGRAGDAALIDSAREDVATLRALQGPSGLFIGGDNVDSPPDSAFTVNDLCDTLRLLETVRHERTAGIDALVAELDAIADLIEPALLAGGVHTPNHRWEISAALARLHRRRPSDALASRVSEWLAEGIDITPDGVYSERSANYAAYVSNPSLSVIADVFGRSDAQDAVVRNLESTLGMIHPDGTVETVHSRRQDQLARFPLAPYLVQYRRFAVALDRGDFAWAAGQAQAQGIVHPGSVLTELLLDDRVGRRMPETAPPAPGGSWEQTGLVVDATDQRRLVVFGGSDYPRVRRIRSGLATNPTFARMFAGTAVLDSVRLSRDFFGLGPFRSESLIAGEGRLRLVETVSANYYQPIDAARRDTAGQYALTDDGRFYGSMSFDERGRDVVSLSTRIDIVPTEDGASIEVAIDGPDCAWALELAFRGGRFQDVDVREDGTAVLESGSARYEADQAAIVVTVDDAHETHGLARYRPGEDYAFLGATDAMSGDRLYIAGRAPATLTVTLRAERASL
ncbi:hypothetical protein [Microbacterium sp. GXF0217]